MNKYPGSLHNHTDFSNLRLRDATNTVNSLIDRAIELGHEVLAITEHDTVASSVRALKYYKKVKEKNPDFKLILGNEIYLVRDGLTNENYESGVDRYYHFILLAKDATGHRQIREISTRAWMRSYMARGMRRVPTYYNDLFEIIGKDPGHVIGSTACLGGAIPTQLLRWRESKSDEQYQNICGWLETMNSLFGQGNFFLEMQPSYNFEQKFVNKELVKLSNRLNIPYIITTDSHYLKKEDRLIHKAFLNSQNGDREVDDFYATTYLMSDDEIREYMEGELGAETLEKAYESIRFIKDSCKDFELSQSLHIPRLAWKEPHNVFDEVFKNLDEDYWYKNMPTIKKFDESAYESDRLLAKAIKARVAGDETLKNKETFDEINACLDDTWVSSEVNKSRWSAYFLNLQKIIDDCWEANSLVGAGRGSGVGFILLYLLGITQINPLRENTKTFRFRFLNPSRVSPLDVDIDIEGGRRAAVMKKFRQTYGEDRVANVLTLRTEKSKSAILTAARGLNIDVDIAQYLASMIQADRGQLRTLDQTFYGDEENGYKPNRQFRDEMEQNYPELWQVAKGIEGLINGCGEHAGGVIFVDHPFTDVAALMKSPKGEIITQFELHDAEDLGLIKYDVLSIEALDKIHNCIDLLCEYGYIDREKTLKETYEKVLGVYNLERDSEDMWRMCWNHEVMSLFQMEKQSGIQGIAAMRPTSVDDLAVLNSAIRLMATEKGGEMPINKLARFKADPSCWDRELAAVGLSSKEKRVLEPILRTSYGLCITQEQFMQLVQLPELGGFDLTFADRLRKSIAKKNPAEYEALTKEFFEETQKRGCNQKLCQYVWNVLIAMSRGYGFNASHTLAYSIIGLQELNLAYRFPIIFWNCACLISDSGGNDINDEEIVEDEEDDDDDEVEDVKTKAKKVNYGKIASAIGKIQLSNTEVTPPDINEARYTFSPDVEHNTIRYGLSGITRLGDDLVKTIIKERPYSSVEDFLNRVKVNKLQMINLIKSGAFDSFGPRMKVMRDYVNSISGAKKRLTLQNLKMLIDYNMIPSEYEYQIAVFMLNKALKKNKLGVYYGLTQPMFEFYEKNCNMDDLAPSSDTESGWMVKQVAWDKYYKNQMAIVKKYITDNHDFLLNKLNNSLTKETWDKYCQGNISKWEMDSVSFYAHEHELSNIDVTRYGLSDFSRLPDEPELDRMIPIKGKQVPIFKIRRIAGTVLDKDKNKKTVTLLTTSGVVTVRIYGDVYSHYDKQISQKMDNGKKKVIEKSWFSRGNKIIVTGIKRDDMFTAKKYSRTPYHLVELITNVDDEGHILTRGERAE